MADVVSFEGQMQGSSQWVEKGQNILLQVLMEMRLRMSWLERSKKGSRSGGVSETGCEKPSHKVQPQKKKGINVPDAAPAPPWVFSRRRATASSLEINEDNSWVAMFDSSSKITAESSLSAKKRKRNGSIQSLVITLELEWVQGLLRNGKDWEEGSSFSEHAGLQFKFWRRKEERKAGGEREWECISGNLMAGSSLAFACLKSDKTCLSRLVG